ncbi:hypothetical protein [Kitasatospora sp. MAP5-34]|uniref:hypothetical protein n=1 Tax=Kitasatospora sp. MAP5-34 TaxID=3035102 RepID=UPI002476996E|nr:hypothetical protein [Kitasatospora sp. MAP5-34]MDH6576914.1 hypothetical protein [Kitasatospora sp. MAP5-34]
MRGGVFLEADWRRETLRTDLWLVPAVEASVPEEADRQDVRGRYDALLALHDGSVLGDSTA